MSTHGIEQILAALKDEAGVEEAVESLRALGRDAISSLLGRLPFLPSDGEAFSAVMGALHALGPQVLEPALAADSAAVEAGGDPLPFLEVLAGLGVRDERVYQRLVEEISPEPEGLTWLFSTYGDPRAIPFLTGLLDATVLDPDSDDRVPVATVLEVAEDLDKLGGSLTEAQRQKVEAAEALFEPEVPVERPKVPETLEELGAALDAAELDGDRSVFGNEHILELFAAIKEKGGEPTPDQKRKVMRVVGFRNRAKLQIEERIGESLKGAAPVPSDPDDEAKRKKRLKKQKQKARKKNRR